MRWIWIAMLAMVMPAARADITLHPGDVVKTNRTVIGHVGAPAEQASVSGYHFKRSEVAVPVGKIRTVLASNDPARPLIVACGGNSFQEPVRGAAALESLAPFGDVLLFDYPGLGASDGSGRKEEYLSAIPPLARLAADLAGQRKGRLIFWGHSLGAGFCAALAANTPVHSTLVLEGAFANYQDVKDAKAGLAAGLVGLTIDPETLQFNIPDLLSAYRDPVVVVASEDDETIPYAATRRLVDRLAGKAVSFITLRGSGHGDLRRNPEYAAKMRGALGLIVPSANSSPSRMDTPRCSGRLVIDGCGTLTWPDGSKLVGEFRGGKFQGPVTVTFADGAGFEAEFDNGDARGTAHYSEADGRRYDGLFVDGEFDSDHTPKEALNFPFWRKLTVAEANINVYVVILPSGDISNLAVDVPSSFNAADIAALDESVRATLLKWKFRPATVDGHPVRLPAVLTIRYQETP